MNRRDLFKRLAAIGIMAATPEPVRRFWQLDQTHLVTERFDPNTSFDRLITGISINEFDYPVNPPALLRDGERIRVNFVPGEHLDDDGTWATVVINGKTYPLVVRPPLFGSTKEDPYFSSLEAKFVFQRCQLVVGCT